MQGRGGLRVVILLGATITASLQGKPAWHSRIGSVPNSPTTFLLDGLQYVLAASGDTLYASALYE